MNKSNYTLFGYVSVNSIVRAKAGCLRDVTIVFRLVYDLRPVHM